MAITAVFLDRFCYSYSLPGTVWVSLLAYSRDPTKNYSKILNYCCSGEVDPTRSPIRHYQVLLKDTISRNY